MTIEQDFQDSLDALLGNLDALRINKWGGRPEGINMDGYTLTFYTLYCSYPTPDYGIEFTFETIKHPRGQFSGSYSETEKCTISINRRTGIFPREEPYPIVHHLEEKLWRGEELYLEEHDKGGGKLLRFYKKKKAQYDRYKKRNPEEQEIDLEAELQKFLRACKN